MVENKNWFVSSSVLEGNEIVTRGRRELESAMNSKVYDHRMEIMWEYQGNDKGMPVKALEDQMNEVAFALGNGFEDQENGLLTAIYQGGNRFIMVFYTKDVQAWAGILHEVLAKYPQLPIRIAHMDDPEWEDYKAMLSNNLLVL